jgi:hypothetical protein
MGRDYSKTLALVTIGRSRVLPGRELFIERGDLVQTVDNRFISHRGGIATSSFRFLVEERAVATTVSSSATTPSTRFARSTRDNKRLGPVLAMIRDEQLRREPVHRSTKAPRRRDQRDARLFKVGELFYEPGELTPTRQNNRCGFKLCCDGRRSGAALCWGSAPARRPIPSDISKWQKE